MRRELKKLIQTEEFRFTETTRTSRDNEFDSEHFPGYRNELFTLVSHIRQSSMTLEDVKNKRDSIFKETEQYMEKLTQTNHPEKKQVFNTIIQTNFVKMDILDAGVSFKLSQEELKIAQNQSETLKRLSIPMNQSRDHTMPSWAKRHERKIDELHTIMRQEAKKMEILADGYSNENKQEQSNVLQQASSISKTLNQMRAEMRQSEHKEITTLSQEALMMVSRREFNTSLEHSYKKLAAENEKVIEFARDYVQLKKSYVSTKEQVQIREQSTKKESTSKVDYNNFFK